MTETEKVMKGIDEAKDLIQNKPEQEWSDYRIWDVLEDALKLIRKQNDIIEEYHRADMFLYAHGWNWRKSIK